MADQKSLADEVNPHSQMERQIKALQDIAGVLQGIQNELFEIKHMMPKASAFGGQG